MALGTGWNEARLRACEAGALRLTGLEDVPLVDCVGRVLARSVVAARALPGFDTAAMDGYAVSGEQPWTLVGRTLAGHAPPPALEPGQAWEVATGAATPPNAEAVIPYERAILDDVRVTAGAHGVNIRRAGEEAAAGAELLPSGLRVSPAAVALAAAAGCDTLAVQRRPQISAIVTGDEVLSSGVPLPGQVRDAIGPALPGWVSWAGGELVGLNRIPDVAGALVDSILAVGADVVLVSGSSSVGAADHLEKSLHNIGATPVVRSVECSPGRTQSLWTLPDGRLLVGMPGNPFAAVVAFLTLVVPACAGRVGAELPALAAAASCDAEPHPTRTRLVPVTLDGDRAVSCEYARSAMVRGLAAADALAVLSPGSDGVELVMLPGGTR